MTVEEQVKALRAKFGDRIPHHNCAICGFWVAYVFDCSSFSKPLEPRELQDLYNFLESNPGWTERRLAAVAQ